MGTVPPSSPSRSCRSSQQSRTSSMWRHIRHRAAGGQIGQDHLLLRGAQDVRRLRHEMDATEHYILGLPVRGRVLGQLQRVAPEISVLDDLVPLIVVAQDDEPLPYLRSCRPDARVELFRRHLQIGDRDLLPLDARLELLFKGLGRQLLVRLAEGRLLYLGDWYSRFPDLDYHVAPPGGPTLRGPPPPAETRGSSSLSLLR